MIKKERLYWICQLGGWFLFTMLELISYITLDGFRWSLIINVCFNFLFGILVTHAYRLFLIKTGWLNLSLQKLIPRGIIAVIVMSLIMAGINIPLDRYTYPILQQYPVNFGFFFGYFFNLSKYILLWSLTYHLFQYWERSLEAEKERYRMAATLKENAYNNLKTQLNPHFLFNSLNSIRTLIDINPDIAKQAITQLSGLLRSSLHMGKSKTVSLSDELQTVKDYLAIEKIRFDERLQTQFSIDNAALDCQVPPMMLQTLVENAVKHGVSNSKTGGIIELDAHKNAAFLHINIINSGQYKPVSGHNGLGLENTKARLQLLYDGGAVFEISNKDKSHVLTHIQLPL